MKRHLSVHGHTPESYREAFGLPTDFPMVHPDYAKARSDLAKAMGLGAGGRQAAKPAPEGKAGRKPKAGQWRCGRSRHCCSSGSAASVCC